MLRDFAALAYHNKNRAHTNTHGDYNANSIHLYPLTFPHPLLNNPLFSSACADSLKSCSISLTPSLVCSCALAAFCMCPAMALLSGIFVDVPVWSINKSNRRILLLETHRNRKIILGCTVYCVIKFFGKNFWTIFGGTTLHYKNKIWGDWKREGERVGAVTITQFLLVRG